MKARQFLIRGRTHVARLTVFVAALALALAATGCGEKQAFVRDYNDAAKPFLHAVRDLTATNADVLSGQVGPREAAKTFSRAADEMGAFSGELRALDPPDAAGDELDRLVGALEAWKADARRMARALRNGDPRTIVTASQAFAEGGVDVVDAEQALREAVEG
jgi:hypothetical protein